METLRPNQDRAKIAIMLLWVVIIFEIFSLISDYFQYDLLQRITSGGVFSMEEATSNDNRQQIIAIFYLIAMIASMIAFICWSRRAYHNLHVRATHLRHSVADALWCWFIPIVCLVRPYRIMHEMHQRTEDLYLQKRPAEDSPIKYTIMSLWWGFWILSGFVGQISFRYSLKAESTEAILNSTILTIISSALGIIGGIFAIIVVKNYATLERLLEDTDRDVVMPEPEEPIDMVDPALP